jgi:hypothetical protein
MKRIYPVTLLIVIIILVGVLYYCSRYEEPFTNEYTIPAVIWTYWNSVDLPEVVTRCIDSWRRYNPTYEVVILNPSNLRDYVDIDIKRVSFNDSPARESDIIRLLVLEKYGGVWSDATVFLTQPYPFSLTSQYQFIGYYLEGFTSNRKYPVLESWFFATIPRGTFITQWRREFFKLEEYESVDQAIENVKKEGIDLQKINSPNYLYIHVAAQKVMQTQNVTDTMLFFKAEDGPYKYIAKNDWNSETALEDLCKGNHRTDIIKFRGTERSVLIDRSDLQDCILY